MVLEPKVYGLVSKSSNSWKSGNPHSGCYETETARTIDTKGGDPTCNQGGNLIVYPDKARALTARHDSSPCDDRGQNIAVIYDARGNGDGKVSPTMTGDHNDRITDYTAVCVEEKPSYCLDRASYNQGQNALFDISIQEEQAQTLVAKGPHAVAEAIRKIRYIVRRLTPLECCRLQGFPDFWAKDLNSSAPTEDEIDKWVAIFETHRQATPNKKGKLTKPKTRNQVKKWLADPHSNSAEYKMWGNSLALPCAFTVLAGIAEEMRKEDSPDDKDAE
jgi:DNA (cytosine-5)-methyltransferase 1